MTMPMAWGALVGRLAAATYGFIQLRRMQHLARLLLPAFSGLAPSARSDCRARKAMVSLLALKKLALDEVDEHAAVVFRSSGRPDVLGGNAGAIR